MHANKVRICSPRKNSSILLMEMVLRTHSHKGKAELSGEVRVGGGSHEGCPLADNVFCLGGKGTTEG